MARKAVLTEPPQRVQEQAQRRRQEEAERVVVPGAPDDGGENATDAVAGDDEEPSTAADDLAPDEIGRPGKLQTLLNTIPGEALLLWAWLESTAEMYDPPLWAFWGFLALAVVATPVYVHRSVETPDDEEPTDREVRWWQQANVQWQSLSAMGALIVWVYYLGGPFAAAGLQDEGIAAISIGIYPVLMLISPYYGSFVLYKVNELRALGGGSAAGA